MQLFKGLLITVFQIGLLAQALWKGPDLQQDLRPGYLGSPCATTNISFGIPERWLSNLVQETQIYPQRLHPVLAEFQDLIESNTRIYMLFESIFQQINNPSYKIRNYHQMLQAMNHVIAHAPSWSRGLADVNRAGLPVSVILEPLMKTPSEMAAFLSQDVDDMIKKVLDTWAEFISSRASTAVLNNGPSGWLSKPALTTMADKANKAGRSKYKFEQLYDCDPKAPHYGFTSWDSFFTRQFRKDVRPVASPKDDNVISGACEAIPVNVVRGVKERDRFWIKGGHYSLVDMFGFDNIDLVDLYTGGIVFQGVLEPFNYHRWHAPVSGKILRTYTINGTHFGSPLGRIGDDPGQLLPYKYGAAMSTRALIMIEADNPAIGEIAFIGIGLVEVSSCEITVTVGQHVTKGDEMGLFHYGSSSHCLVFKPTTKLTGFPEVTTKDSEPVRGKLAIVQSVDSHRSLCRA